MAVFKVGDMVVRKPDSYANYQPGSRYNIPSVPLRVARADGYIVLTMPDGGPSPPLNQDAFDLFVEAPVASPVRTVTRKEIVVGEYGKVKVAGKHSNGIAVGVRLIPAAGGGNIADMTAPDLRAAALVFTQLADALEEK